MFIHLMCCPELPPHGLQFLPVIVHEISCFLEQSFCLHPLHDGGEREEVGRERERERGRGEREREREGEGRERERERV